MISGNITIGGSSFNANVNNAIATNTVINNKLDVGTTELGGASGKSIAVDVINPVPLSTFRGGNQIFMNAGEVTFPGAIRVGTDIIYNGGLYYYDTPIEDIITNISNSNITTAIANIKNTKTYELIRSYSTVKFIKLGRILLPLGGYQMQLDISSSYGWNINNTGCCNI